MQKFNETEPTLVELNQTFLCFDLENSDDIFQEIVIRRISKDTVSWRVRTNAPTCYIVSPNSGTLTDNCNTAKVKFQLVENKFHPSHELLVQAIQSSNAQNEDVWKSYFDSNQLQTVRLNIETTSVNFNNSQHDFKMQEEMLSNIVKSDSKQLEELKMFLSLIEWDCQEMRNNLSKANQLHNVLKKTYNERKNKLSELNESFNKLDRECLTLKQKLKETSGCLIS